MTQLYKKNGAVFIPARITIEEVERIEKENEKLKVKLDEIKNYLANDISHELMNEATNKIWKMV